MTSWCGVVWWWFFLPIIILHQQKLFWVVLGCWMGCGNSWSFKDASRAIEGKFKDSPRLLEWCFVCASNMFMQSFWMLQQCSVMLQGYSGLVIVTAQPQTQPKSTSTRVGVDKVISWTPPTLTFKALPDNLWSWFLLCNLILTQLDEIW